MLANKTIKVFTSVTENTKNAGATAMHIEVTTTPTESDNY